MPECTEYGMEEYLFITYLITLGWEGKKNVFIGLDPVGRF